MVLTLLMGSVYTQMLPKALAAGAPPQTPNSGGERLRPLPVRHAEGKGRQFPSSPRVPEILGTPLLNKVNVNVNVRRTYSAPLNPVTEALHAVELTFIYVAYA